MLLAACGSAGPVRIAGWEHQRRDRARRLQGATIEAAGTDASRAHAVTERAASTRYPPFAGRLRSENHSPRIQDLVQATCSRRPQQREPLRRHTRSGRDQPDGGSHRRCRHAADRSRRRTPRYHSGDPAERPATARETTSSRCSGRFPGVNPPTTAHSIPTNPSRALSVQRQWNERIRK